MIRAFVYLIALGVPAAYAYREHSFTSGVATGAAIVIATVEIAEWLRERRARK